jgi:hypothetical protein
MIPKAEDRLPKTTQRQMPQRRWRGYRYRCVVTSIFVAEVVFGDLPVPMTFPRRI